MPELTRARRGNGVIHLMEELLSDGSPVYGVRVLTSDGDQIFLDCSSYTKAFALFQSMSANVMDIS